MGFATHWKAPPLRGAHPLQTFSFIQEECIRYRDVPVPAWSEKLRELGVPTHLINHLSTMAKFHAQGRYDRMTDEVARLTGQMPMSTGDFMKLHSAEFTRS